MTAEHLLEFIFGSWSNYDAGSGVMGWERREWGGANKSNVYTRKLHGDLRYGNSVKDKIEEENRTHLMWSNREGAEYWELKA